MIWVVCLHEHQIASNLPNCWGLPVTKAGLWDRPRSDGRHANCEGVDGGYVCLVSVNRNKEKVIGNQVGVGGRRHYECHENKHAGGKVGYVGSESAFTTSSPLFITINIDSQFPLNGSKQWMTETYLVLCCKPKKKILILISSKQPPSIQNNGHPSDYTPCNKH